MNTIRDVLAKVSTGEISTEKAEALIMANVKKEDLAYFVVDAFNRGWISNFNIGLNEDGKPM